MYGSSKKWNGFFNPLLVQAIKKTFENEIYQVVPFKTVESSELEQDIASTITLGIESAI